MAEPAAIDPGVGFEVLARDGAARRGRLSTAHGAINTPAFMAVGTAATVKGLTPEEIAASGTEILLGNTDHLMLRPGAERVARLGGLHAFMSWPGPILTDSGGYQVMSLADLREITEAGVTFKSHLDGARHELTPERAVEIQRLLDADITMVLDECTPFPADEMTVAESMRRSLRWAARCRKAFEPKPGTGIFGIVQGGMVPALRRESAAGLVEIGFDGYALGGLAVGEGQQVMYRTIEETVPALPEGRPRYLMGVGKPADMVGASAHTAVLVMAEALRAAGSGDKAALRDAIAAVTIAAATGHISFNGLGEVRKDVQVQIVKDGNWRHYAVISDPALLAPPEE